MLRYAQHDKEVGALGMTEQDLIVTLSPFASLRVHSAKGLARRAHRCFAALSMTRQGSA